MNFQISAAKKQQFLIIHKKKGKKSPEEVEAARKELIQGIREYDEAHPEEQGDDIS